VTYRLSALAGEVVARQREMRTLSVIYRVDDRKRLVQTITMAPFDI